MILKLLNSRILHVGGARTTNSVDAFNTDTTTNVNSDENFSGGDNSLLFGEFGDENSEIVAFTSATGNVLTHAALTKDHPIGTPIYLIKANQVSFQRSATVDGTYAELSKVDINPEDLYTIYDDTTNTTGFGKAKFYNSDATADYGTYYEIIKYSEDDRLTRGFVKEISREEMTAEEDMSITEGFLNRQVTLCDNYIRESRIRWIEESLQVSVETEIGITTYDVSSYVKSDNFVGNILSARINGATIKPMKRDDFYRERGRSVKTTLSSAITSTTDVTVTVTSAVDLADSGSITIEGDSIDYTSVDRDTGILSGVTNIDELHGTTTDDGNTTEVWQSETSGTPMYLTLVDGSIETYPVISKASEVKMIELEVVKTYSQITLDSDELAFPPYLYIGFLVYKIAKKRGDTDWKELKETFEGDLLRYKMKNGSVVTRQLEPLNQNLYNQSRR